MPLPTFTQQRRATHLDNVDGCEVASQAVQAPVSQRQLQEPKQAIDGVVNGHHAPKVGEAEQRPKDGVVGRVQEETPRAPHNQRHNLQGHTRV